MNIVVFEDAGTEQLFPITTGRAAYTVTCASYRLIDWLSEFEGHLVGIVRPYLAELQRLDFPVFKTSLDPRQDWTLLVNARMVPSLTNIKRLKSFASPGSMRPQVSRAGWAITAALIPTRHIIDAPDLTASIEAYCNGAVEEVNMVDTKLSLFEYPHDVVRENMNCFQENLACRIEKNDFQQTAEGVFVAHGAQIGKHVITDSRTGPIVIDRGSSIGPFCFLRGPIYVGPNSKVNEHSAIKDCVSLGHTTKIGGEIEGTVFECYSNKQHHGFLGHSYLGSWINLGAGTCNSDLKNTYGMVNMEYGDQRVATGMQFIGCIMGDYAKSAINTGIFTGKTIGSCSMLYGFVTTNVPSFVNYARSFGQTTELPPAVMVSTQKRMFGRRDVEQRPCDIQLIQDMYGATSPERQLSESPLSL